MYSTQLTVSQELVLSPIFVSRYKLGEFCNTGNAKWSLCRNAVGAEVLTNGALESSAIHQSTYMCWFQGGSGGFLKLKDIWRGAQRGTGPSLNSGEKLKQYWKNGLKKWGSRVQGKEKIREEQDNLSFFFCIKQ